MSTMKRIIALDVGSHTIGVAQSDLLQMIAQPVETLRFLESDWDKAFIALAEIVELQSVEKAIVGLPKNMNNTLGPSAERSQRFVEAFKAYLDAQHLDIQIILADERLTTVQAEKVLISADVKRKNRKKVIDTVAAVLILQNYL